MEITLDAVKNFLESNEDGKKWLQSQTDLKVTKGIETWKTNNLALEIDKKVKELYPDEDPKDKELKEIKKQLDQMKKDSSKKEILNEISKSATEKKLPLDIVKLLVTDDIESTNSNIQALESTWNKSIQELLKGKIESSSPVQGKSYGDLTKDSFASMSYQEKKELRKTNPDAYDALK